MAETPTKRQREETQIEDIEETKRHKSYNHILSLLEAEEDEPNQDLSSLITTLQQELSSDSIFDSLACPTATENDQENPTTTTTTATTTTTTTTTILEDYTSSSSSSCSSFLKEDEEDDKERVIRHLLEASDDELGIPNRENGDGGVRDDGDQVVGFNGGDVLSLYDGLWELEDEAANYYTMLQSELFM